MSSVLLRHPKSCLLCFFDNAYISILLNSCLCSFFTCFAEQLFALYTPNRKHFSRDVRYSGALLRPKNGYYTGHMYEWQHCTCAYGCIHSFQTVSLMVTSRLLWKENQGTGIASSMAVHTSSLQQRVGPGMKRIPHALLTCCTGGITNTFSCMASCLHQICSPKATHNVQQLQCNGSPSLTNLQLAQYTSFLCE